MLIKVELNLEKQYINKNLLLKEDVETGRFAWRSPSNIALVKYWGKFGNQLPSNPSISLTLSESTTMMDLSYSFRDLKTKDISLSYFFENKEAPKFKNKIQTFLESLLDIFPFLSQLDLEFNSTNTFPHSAGIASSASSMSSLALCLCSLERELFGTLQENSEFMEKASYIARLGSGSACRSIFPYAATWGEYSAEGSSLYKAQEFTKLHPVFKTFQDSILIISSEEKAVSSRVGHSLMSDHPFAATRFSHARDNLEKLLWALEKGELDIFGEIVEQEALELHGLMMNSTPSFILMRPNTLSVIEKIREFREKTKTPLYFTLDAGPNVHLLYPESELKTVTEFIKNNLTPFLENGLVIYDKVGSGPLDL